MKTSYFTVALCAIAIAGKAQIVAYPWATRIASDGQEISAGIATDNDCNAYVCGYFESETLVVGTDTLINAGDTDVYLAKYDAAGIFQWARRIGGTDNEIATGVAVDNFGNVCVVGWTVSPSVAFETDTFTVSGDVDGFCVKYSPDGTEIWPRVFGGMEEERVFGVTADRTGNVWLTGGFTSANFLFAGVSLSATEGLDSDDLFVLKYDSLGNEVAAFSGGGSYSEHGEKLVADSAGNVFVTGGFRSDSAVLGATTLTNPNGYEDVFLLKLNAYANAMWAVNIAGSHDDFSRGIDLDSHGNVYIVGSFESDSLVVGPVVLTNLSGVNTEDGFLVKFDSVGSAVWGKTIKGTQYENVTSVAVDDANDVVVCGQTNSPIVTLGSVATFMTNNGNAEAFVAKYDAGGNYNWMVASGTFYTDVNQATAHCGGHIFLTGWYELAPLTLGTTTLQNVGLSDVFVTKFDVTVDANSEPVDYNVSVFPNPSDGLITISGTLPNPVSVKIQDMLGQVIYESHPRPSSLTIDLRYLPGGLYVVVLHAGERTHMRKLVID